MEVMSTALISTHTPHAGRDDRVLFLRNDAIFQLTRPMRGATSDITFSVNGVRISTHTPHAGRDHIQIETCEDGKISTHTPHAGRDLICFPWQTATHISTHTPHAGRDIRAGQGW